MDGAALGVGTDVAGSVRVPAALCGVYALKPTAGRVSVVGAVDPTPGYEGITSVAGPLGRSIDDLELFARLTFGIVGRSTTVAPVPFREQKLHEKLRFGYYLARRAALSTVEALRKAGHECVEIDIPTPNEAFKIWAALSSADGYATLLESKGSDPIETALLPISSIPGRPWFVRRLLSWMVGSLFKDPQLADMMSVNGRKSVQELYQWTAKRNQYMAQFDREIWAEHHLDGIIAPMTAVPQFPHGSFQTIFQIVSATCLYNLLNLPAGVLPITRIDPSLDASTSNASSPSLEYKSTVEKALYAPRRHHLSPDGNRGTP
ncbi:hypothetical protein MKEN_00616600 [Mycena kentingensis (nom. inval.)]|nr:hypothetical protein MKEN_00616600 [Mycena kentingensis (nom. inval.)]